MGGRSSRYIARERLDVRLGNRVLCTIVVDYIPAGLREKLDRIKSAFCEEKPDPQAFSEVEIVPGDGFVWDESRKMLRAAIPTVELTPKIASENDQDMELTSLQQKAQKLKLRAQARSHQPSFVLETPQTQGRLKAA